MGFWLSHSGQGLIRLLATDCDEWKAEELINDAPLLNVVVKLARMGSVHLLIRPLQAMKRPDIMTLDVGSRSILIKQDDHICFGYPFILADLRLLTWDGECATLELVEVWRRVAGIRRFCIYLQYCCSPIKSSLLSVFPYPHRSLFFSFFAAFITKIQ